MAGPLEPAPARLASALEGVLRTRWAFQLRARAWGAIAGKVMGDIMEGYMESFGRRQDPGRPAFLACACIWLYPSA